MRDRLAVLRGRCRVAARCRAHCLRLKRGCLLIMVAIAPFPFDVGRQSRGDETVSVVTGVFIQLTRDNATQNQVEWDRQLRAMAAIGMDTLIVQYVATDHRCYYRTESNGANSSNVGSVRRLLDSAERSALRVFLGLHFDRSFWRGEFDPAKRLEQNRATLDELWKQYGRSPALAGWYIPEEVDDLTPSRNYVEGLLDYFRSITNQAHRVSDLPVMISPYFGAAPNVNAYARWWDEVALPASGVDIVALQDGVGTHRTTIAEAREVFAALAPVMKRHRVAFWANNECFDQTHGSPIDDQPWSARPAMSDEFIRQVRATSPYVEKAITFEFCRYLDPQQSTKTHALYRGYMDYRRRLMPKSYFGEKAERLDGWAGNE
jgi:hypothetical protein